MAAVHELSDQFDDPGDRLARERLAVGPPEPEGIGVGDVRPGHLLRQAVAGDALGTGGGVDLVVDVGDVRHESRLIALVAQEARQQ